MKASFKGILEKFNANGGLAMSYVEVPSSLVKKFKEKKPARLICVANGVEQWHAALMPMGGARFYISLNKTLLKKMGLRLGDELSISLEKDTSEFGMPLPEELVELLAQDEEGNARFRALTPGKQRNIIYSISIPKSSQLRIERSIQLISNLKNLPIGKETVRGIFGIPSH